MWDGHKCLHFTGKMIQIVYTDISNVPTNWIESKCGIFIGWRNRENDDDLVPKIEKKKENLVIYFCDFVKMKLFQINIENVNNHWLA